MTSSTANPRPYPKPCGPIPNRLRIRFSREFGRMGAVDGSGCATVMGCVSVRYTRAWIRAPGPVGAFFARADFVSVHLCSVACAIETSTERPLVRLGITWMRREDHKVSSAQSSTSIRKSASCSLRHIGGEKRIVCPQRPPLPTSRPISLQFSMTCAHFHAAGVPLPMLGV
jgi:hypothetical protein